MVKENTNYKKTLHACYRGYITQAIIVNLAPLFFIIFQDRYNVSFVTLGSIVLLNFVTQLMTDLVSIKFIEKVGYRIAAVMAHLLASIGLVLLGTLPNIMPVVPALVTATLFYSVGGGLLEVIVSPIVDSLPGEEKESSMSLLHSFYCWGQVLVILITTCLLFFIGNKNWHIIPILWAILPIYNLIKFLKVPMLPPLTSDERMPIKKLLNSKIFLVILLLMLCAGASELALAQWASLFTEKALGVSKAIGDVFGPCLFGVLMGVGRTVYGIYGGKVKLLRVLIISSLLCICAYLLASLSQNAMISLVGCALCGLSVSLMWPGMLSFASEEFKTGGTAMFGIMAVFGDMGCSVGPWVIGFVSEFTIATGEAQALRYGVLAAVIFPIVMMIGTLFLQKKRK